MKATELMIGDWVKDKYKPKPHQVDSWADFNSAEDLSPISLTPEILEKNGGKNNHIQPNDGWDIEYRYSAEGGVFIKITEIGDELTPSRNIFAKELDYVHQFQHALCLCELYDLANNFKIE